MSRNQPRYRRMVEERLGRKLGKLECVHLEERLGRKLGKLECVHHVNGDPTDDRWENLLVCTRAQHAAIHWHPKKNAWLVDLLEERQGWQVERAEIPGLYDQMLEAAKAGEAA